MSQHGAFDTSIPVLTEVFEDAPARARASQDDADAAIEARAIAHLGATDWAALERRLSGRILLQLQAQVDGALEQRLREHLETALDQAMAGLTDAIRLSLQQTIEQGVERAVGQQLRPRQTCPA